MKKTGTWPLNPHAVDEEITQLPKQFANRKEDDAAIADLPTELSEEEIANIFSSYDAVREHNRNQAAGKKKSRRVKVVSGTLLTTQEMHALLQEQERKKEKAARDKEERAKARIEKQKQKIIEQHKKAEASRQKVEAKARKKEADAIARVALRQAKAAAKAEKAAALKRAKAEKAAALKRAKAEKAAALKLAKAEKAAASKQAKAEKAAASKQAKARRSKKREAKVLKEASSVVDAAIEGSKQTKAGGRKSKRRKCVKKKAQQEEPQCEFPFMALCDGCYKWVGVIESKEKLDYWACQTCMEEANLLMMQ
jgi:hypothetical protein